MSKLLEDRIACMKKDLEAMEVELKANKQLKPYDWGALEAYKTEARAFRFDNGIACDNFGHKLDILSCINNLKKALGCNWEFTPYGHNYSVFFCNTDYKWKTIGRRMMDQYLIYFKLDKDAKKVAEYLDTHYPNGWLLQQGEA